jgi:molecular chaperone GrpE
MSGHDVDDVGDATAPRTEDADAESAVIEADLEELIVEREKLRDVAQRVQADFENYRKRMIREQTEHVERANEQLISQLLPVLDNFELALVNLADLDEQTRKGFELAYAELLGVLERAGLERVETDGVEFDPNVHEAVMQEGDGEHAVVADAMRSGFLLKGRLLRPAMVKVERKD